MDNKMITKTNKSGYTIYSREYFVEMGRIGGKSGTGKNKKRKTSFNKKTAKIAAGKRWNKTKQA